VIKFDKLKRRKTEMGQLLSPLEFSIFEFSAAVLRPIHALYFLHMRHPVLYSLALVSLLVQAIFGTVGAAAVLCISHHADCQIDVPVEQPTVATPVSSCCDHWHCGSESSVPSARGERADTPTLAFTPPCDEDCGDCVDITISPLDMFAASGQRLDLALAAQDDLPLPKALITMQSLILPQRPNGGAAWEIDSSTHWRITLAQMLRSTRLQV
jgi:hypothetical protein